ncbi:hypothetical protein JCM6882_009707 [Rhodosporidiobolus microsporus]
MNYSSDATDGDLGLSALDSAPPPSHRPPPPHPSSTAPSSTPRPQPGPSSTPTLPPPPPHEHAPTPPPNTKRHTLTRRISFPTDSLDPLLRARLHRWIVAFAVVEFDIDTGPNLDNTYPPIRFPPEVKSNIAFSSLPEGDLPSFSQPSTASLSSSTSSTSSATSSAAGDNGYAYHWRIPYPSESELRRAEEQLGRGKEVYRLPEGDEGDGALHGFVWFVQEKDPTSRRNYTQRSLLLLTHLPSLSGLFSSLLAILGPMHFRHAQHPGAKGGMVETACYNIGAWPDPSPGSTLDLPFLGTVLTVALPLPSQAQFPLPSSSSSLLPPSSSASARGARRSSTYPYLGTPPSPFLSSGAFASHRSSPPPPLLPTSIPPTLPASLPLTPLCVLLFPPYSPSAASARDKVGPVGFTKLLLLWELLVLGEPLVVYASEAKVGAEVVERLRGLIRPIPFAGDCRPYFHVHDRDFAKLCKPGGKPPPGTLIASTNPLLLRNCKSWPHILRLDRAPPPKPAAPPQPAPASAPSSRNASPATRANGFGSSSLGVGAPPSRSNSLSTSAAARRAVSSSSSASGAPARSAGGVKAAADEGKEFGLKSERKRHVRKDEEVRRAVEDAWARGDYLTCDLLLYQHFASLSERFLAPLNRYFATLWAGSGGLAQPPSSSASASSAAPAPLLSPGAAPLPSTRFSPQSFLTSLRTHGSSLPLKPSLSSSFSFSQPSTTPIERFYLRFLSPSNPNYAAWLDDRTKRVGGEVRKRYLRRLEEVDLEKWMEGKGEGEVGEMVGRLEREAGRLALNSDSPSPSPSTTPIPPSSFSNPGLGISHPSPSPSPAASPALSSSFSPSDTLLSQPGARLLKQAERLRELRDERVRSVSGLSVVSGKSGASSAGTVGSGSVYAGSSTGSEADGE